jgi:hypothetical protein
MDDYTEDETFIKAKIQEEVKKRIEKKFVDFVIIKENLTDDETLKITAL